MLACARMRARAIFVAVLVRACVCLQRLAPARCAFKSRVLSLGDKSLAVFGFRRG